MSEGGIFERAGIGFSHVHGDKMPQSATNARPEIAGALVRGDGIVAGVSSAQSLRTDHARERALSDRSPPNAPPVWWFGGGFDLTPYYPFDDDVLHWHRTARAACQPFGADVYSKYKDWCDRYFFLPHRNETRGIGGTVLRRSQRRAASSAASRFMRASAITSCPPTCRSSNAARTTPTATASETSSCYRRGRYVEFNLVYDRGTLFGLQSRGRTESILMSMPPLVRWDYDWQPPAGSPEARLYSDFLRPRDFLADLHANIASRPRRRRNELSITSTTPAISPIWRSTPPCCTAWRR